MLHYPQVESGQGPYPSLEAGMQAAADAADRVYRRYNAQIAYWHSKRSEAAAQ